MKPHDISALYRTLSPRVPSNLFVIVATIVSAPLILVMLVRHGHEPDAAAALTALGGAAQVLLAWAIGRELDPDHPSSAVLAVPVVVLVAHLGPATVVGALTALLALRVVLRPTGLALRPLELVGLPLLAAWSSLDVAGLAPAVVLGAGMLYDARRESPHQPARVASGVAAVLLALLVAAARHELPAGWEAAGPTGSALVALGAVAAAAVAAWPVRQLHARADVTGAQLRMRDLLWARRAAAGIALASFLALGPAALWWLSSLWAALVALLPAAAWQRARAAARARS